MKTVEQLKNSNLSYLAKLGANRQDFLSKRFLLLFINSLNNRLVPLLDVRIKHK